MTAHSIFERTEKCLEHARIPALTIPCGFTAAGLPIGMQLVGPQWTEARLLAIGVAYQDATDFQRRRPPVIN